MVSVALMGTLLAAGRSAAQDAEDVRLTVRPHEMATGTRTEKTGVFPMPGNSKLYVPPKCVGTQRCPLLVTWPDANPDSVIRYFSRGVDEFGILLLVTTDFHMAQPAEVDSALQRVLAEFAVDPDRMAICPMSFAFANPNVFNRAFVHAGPAATTTYPPGPGPRLELYEDAGIMTDYPFALTTLTRMADLRAQGYATKQWLGLRAHGFDDYHGYGPQATFYFLTRWLDQSWRIPDPAKRPKPAVVADPLPLLTSQMVTQMITFWESFQQESDSIRGAVRHRYLREVLVPIGPEDGHPSAGMVDMAAFAAKVPSVAAKLKAAGLTAQQHDAYRVALLSAILLAAARDPAIWGQRHPSLVVNGSSVMGKNVAFVLAHPDELLALEQTAIWMTP